MRRFAWLLALVVRAQDDDFQWFRCDACSASFFKINRTLVEKQLLRRASVASYEFLEIVDEVCDTMFTKEEYGVKQHEGKKYLFGPGVSDHIPGQGFGQMGMGDYDKRLASYCKMFVEEFGEDGPSS
ncbi:Marginal zone B- and B1-cell-specific protein (Plasma cell-induced resident endoplasmic reticulum protein) (Plasma cell-induced resident ER protein) (pERp1) (Proapoptotic caspase adapter protein) [Durusdinium trenchii]|uniref:Marginal zone B- and B1-cell-specific protein (Plasma cell-induced resident endoplasmic reticulum protein) (Plasma cell-induced resident ER protein) (PERp1) (Proapoptotic caspase adapter protein) n=1 Tax=Durusdinium trenchii TaxID=1381693 RepID=A0ABP0SAH0_9DINO